MPATHFKTVYDAASAGYTTWGFVLPGLLFMCVGYLLLNGWEPATRRPLNQPPSRPWQDKPRKSFAWIFMISSVGWTALAFGATYRDYRHATSDLKSGKYYTVEGPITDFVPQADGRKEESFAVSGYRFSYSTNIITGGYNHSGSILHDGLYVRVSYTGNTILRLETAQ